MTKPHTDLGAPSFIELGSPDPRRARTFYAALLHWDLQDMGEGCHAKTATAGIGMHPETPASGFVVYFNVGDIDAAIVKVHALGGTTEPMRPGSEGFGRFVECTDDQGIRFGLRQLPT